MTTRTTSLPGGLTVVTEEMPSVASAAVGFWVGVGARDEPAPEQGASHFLEHLLFKGTEERSAAAIAETVDAGGGEMNAFTTKEYTAFYVRLLAEQALDGIDLLSDIMWRPAFRPDEVEAERQVILEEILLHGDEPDDEVHDLHAAALWPAHPLGRDVLGDAGTIQSMTRDGIASFHRRWYRPANVVVAAAGRIDHDRVVERVRAGLDAAGVEAGGDAPVRTPPVAPPRSLLVRTDECEQAHVVVGMRALDANDADRYALTVVDQVLGGGLSSRMFQEVREKRGLAYSVYSHRSAFADSGCIGVYAGTAPSRVHDVLEVLHRELDRMAAGGITERELEVAKSHLRGSLALGLEDSGARMQRIGRGQLVHGRVIPVEEVLRSIDVLTLDDVHRVIARVLPNPRVQAVIGPFEERDFVGMAS